MRRPFLVALGLAALIAAMYCDVLVLGETFVLRDALRFTLPSREALSAAFAAGRIPEWFDGVGFGVAFAANPVHGVTSPLTWLLSLSRSAWAFDALTLVQLLILASGAAALTRRLGASLAGAFFSGAVLVTSGFVVSAVPNGSIPYVTWIPWMAFAACVHADGSGGPRVGRWTGAAFAAVMACQLLAGEPAFELVAALLTLAVVLGAERPLAGFRRLLVPTIGGIGLAAVGLLPAFILLGQSARAHGPPAGLLQWSMHPGRILECIWPLAFGAEGNESWFVGPALGLPTGDPCYALSLYMGAPVLVLALTAGRERRIRLLLVSSFGFAALALGSYTPLYGALRFLFPPLQWINFPEKFFFGVLLTWVVCAGVGFTSVFQNARPGRWLDRACLVSAALLAAGGVAARHVQHERQVLASWLGPHSAGLNVGEGLALSATGGGVAAAGAALFALALMLRRRRASTAIPAILALCSVAVPLVFAARVVTPLVSRAFLTQTPRLLAALPRPPLAAAGVRPRLFVNRRPRLRPALETGTQIATDIHEMLDTNVASRFGYGVLPGFESGDSARFHRFWDETIAGRMSFLAFVRLLGIDFAFLENPERFAPGFPVLARLPGWGIVGTFSVRPRAFVAPRATVAGSVDEGLASLASPEREGDPARVVIAGADAEALELRGPLVSCAVTSRRPEEVDLDCRSPNGGYAVLLDENMKGWSAELDGQAARILTADGLFRAVRVGAGSHRIVFRYRTPGLRAGALVSLLTFLTLVFAVARPSGRGEKPLDVSNGLASETRLISASRSRR